MKNYQTAPYKLLLICALVAIGWSAQAQDFNDRSFHSIGQTAYLDFVYSPLYIKQIPKYHYSDVYSNGYRQEVLDSVTYSPRSNRLGSFCLLTLYYKFRFNVVEIYDDLAVSVSTSPAISIPNDVEDGWGWYNIPFLVNLEIGTAATSESFSEAGVSIGAGIEMNKLGIIEQPKVSTYGAGADEWWLMPVIDINFRTGDEFVSVMSYKFGFSGEDEGTDPRDNWFLRRSFTARISYAFIID